jgi:ribonuclease HII
MALIKDAGARGFYEKKLLDQGVKLIAGVDEAGRGPCAGPLVVAAVILQDIFDPKHQKIKDSKTITENNREELYDYVLESAVTFSIIEIPAAEIDKNGLHVSNLEGMATAAINLNPTPERVLFDGYQNSEFQLPSDGIWKGDASCISIAAASILAKVTRDRIMRDYDLEFPQYGFAKHKGYSAPEHMKAIADYGLLPIHRRSFKNIAAFVE